MSEITKEDARISLSKYKFKWNLSCLGFSNLYLSTRLKKISLEEFYLITIAMDDINSSDNSGNTLSHFFVTFKDIEKLNMLGKAGANFTTETKANGKKRRSVLDNAFDKDDEVFETISKYVKPSDLVEFVSINHRKINPKRREIILKFVGLYDEFNGKNIFNSILTK